MRRLVLLGALLAGAVASVAATTIADRPAKLDGLRQLQQRFERFRARTDSRGLTALLSRRDPFDDAPVPAGERRFLINGWRWHHRAAVRELRRLIGCLRAAERTGCPCAAELCRGYDFVWGFSWRALHSIEAELYLPWLRAHLPARHHGQLAALEADLHEASRLGANLGERLGRARDARGEAQAQAALTAALRLSEQLAHHAQRTYSATERTLVPCVAAHVPAAEQCAQTAATRPAPCVVPCASITPRAAPWFAPQGAIQ
jgi:hypothetical protein